MITLLRRRHRQLWLAMAPAGLAIIVLATATRPDPAVVERLPPVLRQASPAEESWDSTPVEDLGVVVITELSGSPALTLRYAEPLRAPDPLLYWSADAADAALPADAVLLGPLQGTDTDTVALSQTGGHLTIFSLGHGTVVSSFPNPRGTP